MTEKLGESPTLGSRYALADGDSGLLFVSQAETERVLEEHVESLGVKLERPVELLTFTQDAEGVSARLRLGDDREENARARYIVGADGVHSVVRKNAGLSFEGGAYPQDFVLADTEVAQLGIKYPDSPIVGEELREADRAFRRGPAAGHRAPDGPLRPTDDSRTVSLLSRLRGTSHHLLLFGSRDSAADGAFDAELRDLVAEYEGLLEPHLILAREPARVRTETPVYVDESGLVHERYGLKDAGCYLIRPDGYVAFRAPGSDLQSVRAYLQRVFTRTRAGNRAQQPVAPNSKGAAHG